MARLFNRKFQKSFGKDGNVNNFGQFGSVNAGSPLKTKDIATIQALAAWLTGLQDEVISSNKAPFLEDFNAVFYMLFYQICYLFQDGVPLWNTDTTYFLYSVVGNGNGCIYFSLADDNLGNAPPSDGTDNANWTCVYPVRFDTLRGLLLTSQIDALAITDAKIAGMSSSKLVGPVLASQVSGVKRLLANRSTAAADVTGDGTNYTIPFNNVDIDTDAAYNPTTGVYTIPSGGTGLWEFSGQISLKRTTVSGSVAPYFMVLVVVNGSIFYRTVPQNASVPGLSIASDPIVSIPYSFQRQCVPTEQVTVQVQAVGGSKNLGLSVVVQGATTFRAELKI